MSAKPILDEEDRELLGKMAIWEFQIRGESVTTEIARHLAAYSLFTPRHTASMPSPLTTVFAPI
jgi:hypothetical protein